jgi:hypothetical protein
VGQPGAGAGLVKGGNQRFLTEQVGVLTIFGKGPEFFGNVKNSLKFVSFKIFQRQNVSS